MIPRFWLNAMAGGLCVGMGLFTFLSGNRLLGGSVIFIGLINLRLMLLNLRK